MAAGDSLARAKGLLAELEGLMAGEAEVPEQAGELITQLKIQMMDFPSLPPSVSRTATAAEEVTVARSALELACEVAIRNDNPDALTRSFAQLRPYYTEYTDLVPASEKRLLITALWMMSLLVDDQPDQFHLEVEFLSEEDKKDKYIKFVMEQEQQMTSGAYNKVLEGLESPPSFLFACFADSHEQAVQLETAACIQASYESLPVARVLEMLNLESVEEAQELVEEEKDLTWEFDTAAGVVRFRPASKQAERIEGQKLLQNMIQYATDLERIV